MIEDGQYKVTTPCGRFNEELEAFMEGEARPFINSHALDCAACSGMLADLRAIQTAAQELPLASPPGYLWNKVRASLGAEAALRSAACLRFEDELGADAEGFARPFITAHGRECAACAGLLADLQAVSAAAQNLPLEEPSPNLWLKVRAQLEAEGAFARTACLQFESELEAYLEGEARPFVESHVAACAACQTLLADLEAIREAAHSLPAEEPSRVVWANVRARLEAEGAFGRPVSGWRQILSWRPSPQAIPFGVLTVLVLLASVIAMPSRNSNPAADSASVANLESVAPPADALPSSEYGSLAHVVSDLESNFRANEASMTPGLKATYEKSLVSLDASINECLDSLHHEPSNALAHDYLLTAYTRKAEILSSALEYQGR